MMFSKESSEIAKKVFNKYDKNKDGSLSVDELKPLLEKLAESLKLPKPTDESIQEGIKRLDINKNGVLEFNEFYRFFLEIYNSFE